MNDGKENPQLHIYAENILLPVLTSLFFQPLSYNQKYHSIHSNYSFNLLSLSHTKHLYTHTCTDGPTSKDIFEVFRKTIKCSDIHQVK